MAHTFQNNILCLFKAPGLRQFRQANRLVPQLMLAFSVCILVFASVSLAGNHNVAEAGVYASTGSSHDAALEQTPFLPQVSILSPTNTTYTLSQIDLTFEVNEPISWAGYSLSGQANITIVGNSTLTNLAQGSHSIVVYVNDTAGYVASSQTVYFMVGQVSILEMVPLGIIQGLTEWLPVSSTAHLKIAQHLEGLEATPLLDVTLHVGTLIVVIFYFRKDIVDILSALVHLDFKSEYGRFIPLIIVATIPTGIIGVLYAEFLENTFQTLLIIGITFLIGATYLYTSRIGKED
ncbi:MAG TPA: undecaprenyl-diphosphate phosphatase, partial [Candidatus Acidoferrum sp.]|nr:undecaprenyl-diphosphate phosphatase [Candidatus Acidoferrum sp.]